MKAMTSLISVLCSVVLVICVQSQQSIKIQTDSAAPQQVQPSRVDPVAVDPVLVDAHTPDSPTIQTQSEHSNIIKTQQQTQKPPQEQRKETQNPMGSQQQTKEDIQSQGNNMKKEEADAPATDGQNQDDGQFTNQKQNVQKINQPDSKENNQGNIQKNTKQESQNNAEAKPEQPKQAKPQPNKQSKTQAEKEATKKATKKKPKSAAQTNVKKGSQGSNAKDSQENNQQNENAKTKMKEDPKKNPTDSQPKKKMSPDNEQESPEARAQRKSKQSVRAEQERVQKEAAEKKKYQAQRRSQKYKAEQERLKQLRRKRKQFEQKKQKVNQQKQKVQYSSQQIKISQTQQVQLEEKKVTREIQREIKTSKKITFQVDRQVEDFLIRPSKTMTMSLLLNIYVEKDNVYSYIDDITQTQPLKVYIYEDKRKIVAQSTAYFQGGMQFEGKQGSIYQVKFYNSGGPKLVTLSYPLFLDSKKTQNLLSSSQTTQKLAKAYLVIQEIAMSLQKLRTSSLIDIKNTNAVTESFGNFYGYTIFQFIIFIGLCLAQVSLINRLFKDSSIV